LVQALSISPQRETHYWSRRGHLHPMMVASDEAPRGLRPNYSCGSLAAAEQLEAPMPTPTSRQLKRTPPLAFLGARRTKLRPDPSERTTPVAEDEIYMGDVPGADKLAKKFTSKQFIFSDALTARSPLQEELDEFQSLQDESKDTAQLKGLVTIGGSGVIVYGAVKGLQGVERFFKWQEKKDIAEEMELTGQYVSFDAGEVEGAVDPKTGKNITVAKGAPTAAGGEAAKIKRNADGSEAPKEQVPWILRVLGVSDNDDDFWEQPMPEVPDPPPTPAGGAAADGAEDGDGGDGGDGGGGVDDTSDDSDDLDTLDDLLG